MDLFKRNYGATKSAREYWGGNNGFVTIIMTIPADVEMGEVKAPSADQEKAILEKSIADRNLHKLVEALAQRGVLVTTSQLREDVDGVALKDEIEEKGKNVLAIATKGTLKVDSFAVTFEVERANVYDKQENKPGSTYALVVDPTADLVEQLTAPGLFTKKDGSAADAVDAIVVKVFDALPPILF